MSSPTQRTFTDDKRPDLEGYLRHTLGAERVEIHAAALLSGGAVQENWRLGVSVAGGSREGEHAWVLRTDALARLPVSLDRTAEFRVLSVAHSAGISVAEPLVDCADASILGAPFMILTAMPGTANARTLTRDPNLETWGADLAYALGTELARIHQIRPQSQAASDLGFLPRQLLPPAHAEVQRLRNLLDSASEARPALEYILNWLERHAPVTETTTLVHGDFRTGNFLVDDGTLSAILDWEFAHWGDPLEDLGWFCARGWRFGADDREAGGLAPRSAVLEGYRSVSGRTITAGDLVFWEILAAAKWAAIAVLQGDRYRTGGEDSLELVLTGLLPPEMELDALLQIEAAETQLPA